MINIRRLTCCECKADQNCLHYGIGPIFFQDNDDLPLNKKRLRYEDVYDTESDLSDNEILRKTPSLDDYVIVQFSGKRTIQYYIGLVFQKDTTEIMVKFFKKSSGNKYVFPEVEDVSVVDYDDVVCILNQPEVNQRQQYEFVIEDTYKKFL